MITEEEQRELDEVLSHRAYGELLQYRAQRELHGMGSLALLPTLGQLLSMAEKGHVEKILESRSFAAFQEIYLHTTEVGRRRFRFMAEKAKAEEEARKNEVQKKRYATRLQTYKEQLLEKEKAIVLLQAELKKYKGNEVEAEWLEAGRQEGYAAGLEAGKLKMQKQLQPRIEELERKVDNQRQHLNRIQEKGKLRLVV